MDLTYIYLEYLQSLNLKSSLNGEECHIASLAIGWHATMRSFLCWCRLKGSGCALA